MLMLLKILVDIHVIQHLLVDDMLNEDGYNQQVFDVYKHWLLDVDIGTLYVMAIVYEDNVCHSHLLLVDMDNEDMMDIVYEDEHKLLDMDMMTEHEMDLMELVLMGWWQC